MKFGELNSLIFDSLYKSIRINSKLKRKSTQFKR